MELFTTASQKDYVPEVIPGLQIVPEVKIQPNDEEKDFWIKKGILDKLNEEENRPYDNNKKSVPTIH